MITITQSEFIKDDLAYATKNSAGFDIRANESGILNPKQIKIIPTGMFIKPTKSLFWRVMSKWMVPELQIRPRSGLAAKNWVSVANTPGTIDFDYPQEIMVILINHGEFPFSYKKGDRIAQGVVSLVFRAGGVKVPKTKRTSGLGSTGVK